MSDDSSPPGDRQAGTPGPQGQGRGRRSRRGGGQGRRTSAGGQQGVPAAQAQRSSPAKGKAGAQGKAGAKGRAPGRGPGQGRRNGASPGTGGPGGRRGSRGGHGGRSSGASAGPAGGTGRSSRAPTVAAEVAGVAARTSGVAGGHRPAGLSTDRRVQSNRRRLLVLCIAGGLAPGLVAGVVLGLVVGPLAGAVTGAVVLAVVAVSLARGAVPIALRAIGGRAVSDAELPALANLVHGLCATFGVRPPHLRLVDEPVANACAVAGTSGRAVLVVTTGLVERLGLIELEGVVAHELAHVKCHDAAVSAVGVATIGPLARLTGSDRWLRAAVGRDREYAADRMAVLEVRYPPGLRDALAAFARNPAPVSGSVFTGRRWAATRWVWIDPMVGQGEGAAPEGLIDATAVRRAALSEW